MADNQTIVMKSIANNYLHAGLCVLPAIREQKRPAIRSWKRYQDRLPTETEVHAWFSNHHDGLCIVTGKVSGNLEIIDFDNGGELFDTWYALIEPALRDQLVIEQTPSGGWHVCYRCRDPVCGNLKLAQRKKNKIQTLIETRGEGGLFLCAPTLGYELMQGDLANLAILTCEQRESLLQAAWSLNEYIPEPVAESTHTRDDFLLRPGDDFNQRGEITALLQAHGWQLDHTTGENQRWRRPGKPKGWSATLRTSDKLFYVFSSNAPPFEPNKAYSPFSVYTLLEYGGDYSQAAKQLGQLGFGSQDEACHEEIDLSGILDDSQSAPETIEDPGPIPERFMRIPGFISELMDFSLQTAPYPNSGLSFCGAVALQSFLCGRKVRDPGNLRTNLYLLSLAGSSSGKDWPRQINAHLMMEINELTALGDKFASGEGIQDALFLTPSMLFQNDEIDGLLLAINGARDGRHESIMTTLLTVFTSSGSIYPMRRKAGKESGGIIDQPHLTLFGTATPKYYYEALSERMLTNGFFARMIVIDIGTRGKGQDAGLVDRMPERLLETAKWWHEFTPGRQRGDLIGFHPQPLVIEQSRQAREVLDDFRCLADTEYAQAELDNNEAAKAIWGRANENARKLALIYASSENHRCPQISQNAASWSVQFVDHQIRRMLFLASQHVAENDFDKKCKKMIEILRTWKQQKGEQVWMPHWELARRLKGWNEKDIEMVRDTLSARLEIEYEVGSTSKRGRTGYRYRMC